MEEIIKGYPLEDPRDVILEITGRLAAHYRASTPYIQHPAPTTILV